MENWWKTRNGELRSVVMLTQSKQGMAIAPHTLNTNQDALWALVQEETSDGPSTVPSAFQTFALKEEEGGGGGGGGRGEGRRRRRRKKEEEEEGGGGEGSST
ncbi:hypothetical protein HGM15179_004756 [Zosterops borbonicus]|uniref:Uncharacterized protein n=1 Tax=Zosterops borbonicus TaxID=364589 RepID=A0A8K1LQR9_9PASS|nr:hypothetical protein HGM15179_004756 [Zosterops borbonicus]